MNSPTGGASSGPVAPPEGNLFITAPLTREDWVEKCDRELAQGQRLVNRIADLDRTDPQMRRSDSLLLVELFDRLSQLVQTIPMLDEED